MDKSNIKYPIYIVSKGRYENPITAKLFLKENIEFKIAVEPQEYDNYCKTIPKENILKLPFANLGVGSYPARNYCWENSIKNGNKKHWIFDDNIRHFVLLNKGVRTNIDSKIAIINLENFAEKYNNLAIIGFNYRYFVTKYTNHAYNLNCHVYSGMLIKNSIPYKWRLKYNEDVDLCLQCLVNGMNTVLFNQFLIDKVSTTLKLKGGNQTELYCNNDYGKKVLKAESLRLMWQKYVKIVMRFNRPHHYINWRQFKQPLT